MPVWDVFLFPPYACGDCLAGVHKRAMGSAQPVSSTTCLSLVVCVARRCFSLFWLQRGKPNTYKNKESEQWGRWLNEVEVRRWDMCGSI